MSDKVRVFSALVLIIVLVGALVGGGMLWVGGDRDAVDSASDVLEPMPSAPVETWRRTAHDIFGDQVDAENVSPLAEHDGALILLGSPAGFGRKAALMAIDAYTGRPLWRAPKRIGASSCAFVSTGELACVGNLRTDGAIATHIDFLDPQNGQTLSTAVVGFPGWPKLQAVGGRFVLAIEGTVNIALPEEVRPGGQTVMTMGTADELPDQRGLIVGFDSTGRRLWTTEPPINHTYLPDEPDSSSVDLFSLQASRHHEVSVYRADTGRLIYASDSTATGNAGVGAYEVYSGGFAVSTGMYTNDAKTEFFNGAGRRTAELPSWRLSGGGGFFGRNARIEHDSVPLMSTWGFRLGVSNANGDFRWKHARPQMNSMQSLDDRYLAGTTEHFAQDGRSRTTWDIVDIRSGESISKISVLFGQQYFRFDGRRLLFQAAPSADQSPNGSRLTAYDVVSGQEAWRVDPPDDGGRWEPLGRYLFRMTGGPQMPGTAKSPAAIARYSDGGL